MKNKLEYFLFFLLYKAVTLFPLKISRLAAYPLGFLFYHLIPIRKKVAKKNIRIAFPEKDEKGINSILKRSYINFAKVIIEILFFKKFSKEQMKEIFEIDTTEVKKIQKQGNPVIILSAHFGNWELLAYGLAAAGEVPVSIIIKDVRNIYVDRFVNEIRGRAGNRLVKAGVTIKETLRELQNKNAVALLADQRAPQESEHMDFFGKSTAVFTGPAGLSIRTGAPIFLYFVCRKEDGNYFAKGERLFVDENLPEKEKIKVLTRMYLDKLEQKIREYPDHWLWFHDRWRD